MVQLNAVCADFCLGLENPQITTTANSATITSFLLKIANHLTKLTNCKGGLKGYLQRALQTNTSNKPTF